VSIRLRLTLLYSVILVLTLILFSTTLYLTQAQVTLGDIKTNLTQQADAFAHVPPHFPDGAVPSQAEATLPGRWTQTRNPDGTVKAQTPDLSGTALPLSDAGLRAVQNGTGWFETAQVQAQPLLIYSEPVLAAGQLTEIVQVAAPIAQREQSLNTLRIILIIGTALVSVAAFIIGWLLAGTALGPIHRLTETAKAIGNERNFSQRVEHVGPNDEIGQLAITFNGMLTELESAYRQVEQALESQRRFVADASHELRTPLTTVRGNIELLHHEPPMSAQERTDVLADTKDEVERLIRLVQQLLVLARADAGRELRHESVAIRPLIEDVCRQTKLLAPDRTIVCESIPDATALGDCDALKQVLLILLDNARTHTSPRSTIGVTTAVADGQVAISVRDTGLGISPDVLPHIFERFYRGDASRTGTSSGLGLSIAQELVQVQGGTITVESKVGRGTVFTVTLPQASE
jgi:two-component system, OmpR family, sensor kinase